MDKKEYIEYAKKNQQVMELAIRDFSPYYADADFLDSFPISAPGAEAARQTVLEQEKQSAHKCPIEQYCEYDADVIQSIANSVWFGMPESMASREHPGFWAVCNLAEGYDEV